MSAAMLTALQRPWQLVRLPAIGPVAGAVGIALLLVLAVGRVHVRVQSTLMGYEIGRLKNEESKLLEERSFLRMQLAKLTTKKHLMLMTDSKDDAPAETRTYALK